MEDEEILDYIMQLKDVIKDTTKALNDIILRQAASMAALIEILELTNDQKLDFHNRSKEIYQDFLRESGLTPTQK